MSCTDQVVHLLEQDDAEHGIQLLGRTTSGLAVEGTQLVHGEAVEDLLAKQVSP